jgi:UDP-sulfoquinovose synthase
LGWPTAMHFSERGDEVLVVDNFSKRKWELEEGITPLGGVPTLHERIQYWHEATGKTIQLEVGDITNHRQAYTILESFQPDAIVHYGEQPSAPYSMQSREKAVFTQQNNIIGTLNLLFAMQHACPQTHLIKLGTMGEYGTPNIDIEEGWLELTHNGRADRVLFPKRPGSFYHLSKVHDSHNIEFACRIWGIRATDLNQGVVYGIETPLMNGRRELRTSFHYDHVFGTVLNRFLAQAAAGTSLTIYGSGGQTRGFLNLKDTIQCVALAADHPASEGEFRVFNQFTEQFSVNQLAQRVVETAARAGVEAVATSVSNPRVELEDHYYNAQHTALIELGLQPTLLTDTVLDEMFDTVHKQSSQINSGLFPPSIKWAANKGD